VAVLPVRADGGIGEPVCNVEVGKQAHMAIPSLSGATLFVPCKGIDRVVSFSIDVATGQLTRLATEAATAAGAGPRHLALAADGRSAWLVNELGNTVQPATLDPSGAVRLGAAVATLPAGWSGASTGGGILLAGGLLLASNRGQDSLAVFRLAADGTPTVASHAAVPRTPRHVAVDPSGRWILAACQDADQVAVLRLDAAKAALLPVATVAVPGKPAFVIALP
jgi:6-phosphogluconolactonase